MNQYCRYCAFCFEGDGYYCSRNPSNTEPDAYLTEAQIKRVNHCPNFVLSDLGDVETGRKYKERQSNNKKHKEISTNSMKQLSLF